MFLSRSLSRLQSHSVTLSLSCPSCLDCPRPVCRFKKKRLRACHQHAHVYQQMTMSPGPVVHIGRTRQSGSMVFPPLTDPRKTKVGKANRLCHAGSSRRDTMEANGCIRTSPSLTRSLGAAKAEPRGTSPTSSPRKRRTTTTAWTTPTRDPGRKALHSKTC